MNDSDVDAYIARTPDDVQGMLTALRRAIKEAVPQATERMSYGMPHYDHHGRLVYFGLAKRHIGLYIPTPIVEQYKEELAGYHAVQATIHLPLDQDLPIELIQKLVQARAALNEASVSSPAP